MTFDGVDHAVEVARKIAKSDFLSRSQKIRLFTENYSCDEESAEHLLEDLDEDQSDAK